MAHIKRKRRLVYVLAMMSALTFILPFKSSLETRQSQSLVVGIEQGTELGSSSNRENWLADYIIQHKRGIGRLKGGKRVKTLVFTCHQGCGGTGDRMSAVASAFYAAVSLKRTFLIDYTNPVPLNLTLVPNNVDWDNVHLVSESATSKTVHVMDTADPMSAFGTLIKSHDSDVDTLRLQANGYFIGMTLWTPSIYSQPITREFRHIGSMYRLHLRHHYRSLTTAESFHLAFHTLFNFSDEVEKRAQSMLNEIGLSFDSDFIGIHARIGGKVENSKHTAQWTDPERHSLDDIDAFLKCYRIKANSSGHSGACVLFSDSIEFKEKTSSVDPQVKYIPSTTLVHVDRSDGADDIIRRGNIDVHAELYLLSKSSCIIGSHSTFSGLAAVIARQIKPCFVIFDECTDPDSYVDYFERAERNKLRF